MNCALILAGGRGERFWPISTEERPKQFAKILGEKTMIQMTVERINKLIPLQQIFVVTSEEYVELTKEQLPQIPEGNIIIQPYVRNTAPVIALSTMVIEKKFGDASIVVLPSDHQINDVDKFVDTIDSGFESLEKEKNQIITLGINPTRPEIGYGYIKYKDDFDKIKEFEFHEVESFHEKPDIKTASIYFISENYLWNSGIFLWKTSTLINLIKTHTYSIYEKLNRAIEYYGTEDYKHKINSEYENIEDISIDKGVLEKCNNIFVIPSDFGWDDVGSWSSVERYRSADDNENIIVGNVGNIVNKNNYVMSFDTCTRKKVIMLGLKNMFVIDSNEALIIGNREELENVSKLKKEFREIR